MATTDRIGNDPLEVEQQEEYVSAVEKFCSQVFAERILTSHARMTIIVAWIAALITAIYGI